jgi:hypothetical protein
MLRLHDDHWGLSHTAGDSGMMSLASRPEIKGAVLFNGSSGQEIEVATYSKRL